MSVRKISVFIVLLFVGFAAAEAAERPKLLVLGDSLSAGFGMDLDETWVAMLQTKLDEEGYGYTVVNASISGDTTDGGLQRLPRALRVHQPDIVIIELGGNDGLRALPVKRMKANLEAMITRSQEAGAKVLLAGMMIPPNYGQAYTEAFAAAYGELAETYDVALIPFFLDGVALNPELMQADGIHPNTKAQPILLDNVWPTLESELLKPLAAANEEPAEDSSSS